MNLDLHSLLTEPFNRTPPWIEGGILRKGGILLFGGTAGVGKTFLVLNMIRSMIEGGRFLGLPQRCVERPEHIVYLDGEIGQEELTDRTRAVFKGCTALEPGMVTVGCHMHGLKLDTLAGRTNLLGFLKDLKPTPGVLILDPVSYFMSRGDEDNLAVQELYENLILVQQEVSPHLSFVLSHHFRKKPSGKGMELYEPLDASEFRGASKWTDVAWGTLALDRLQTNPDGGWDLNGKFVKVRSGLDQRRMIKLQVAGPAGGFRVGMRPDPDSPWAV